MDLRAPALVGFDDHLRSLVAATEEFTRAAASTWLGARVVTCPEWDVLDLLAHQGMVHRWATAAIRCDHPGMGNASLSETEGRTATDPVAWLRTGAAALEQALQDAPDDLDTLVFLKSAPKAKEFWARRQCHETTIHALDAQSAWTGRMPSADEAWFGQDLAADGVDELLVGFFQRSRTQIRSATPYTVHVRPTDAPVSWVVQVGDGPIVTTRLSDGDDHSVPDEAAVLHGSAVDLYLALWNRGGSVSDAGHVLDRWRQDGAVRW